MNLTTKNKPHIITISGEAGSGKDTLADMLMRALYTYNSIPVQRMAYADYLKLILEKQFGWDGQKDAEGRTLLQTVGSQGRQKDVDFWVKIVATTVETFEFGDVVILSDARYFNEIDYWKKNGYPVTTIKIDRPGYGSLLSAEQSRHSSENDWRAYKFDKVFTNTSLDDLNKQVMEYIAENLEQFKRKIEGEVE